MIVLHRAKNHSKSDSLEERLRDLVLSFEIVFHSKTKDDLPFIEEDGREFKGEKSLDKWLRELEAELNWQRSLSGDGCYLDPKSGEIC